MFRALLFGAAGLSTWNQLPDWGQYTITGITALFLLNLVYRILKPTISVGMNIIRTFLKIGRWTVGKLRNTEKIEKLNKIAIDQIEKYHKVLDERNRNIEKLGKAKNELYLINQEVPGISGKNAAGETNIIERIRDMKGKLNKLVFIEEMNTNQRTALREIREITQCKENENIVEAVRNLANNYKNLAEETKKIEEPNPNKEFKEPESYTLIVDWSESTENILKERNSSLILETMKLVRKAWKGEHKIKILLSSQNDRLNEKGNILTGHKIGAIEAILKSTKKSTAPLLNVAADRTAQLFREQGNKENVKLLTAREEIEYATSALANKLPGYNWEIIKV